MMVHTKLLAESIAAHRMWFTKIFNTLGVTHSPSHGAFKFLHSQGLESQLLGEE